MINSTLLTFRSLLIFLAVALVSVSCSQESEEANSGPKDPKLDKLKLQSGFRAEHLYSPSDNDMGSWVAMAFDDQGRLITSDQYGALYRLNLAPIGTDSLTPGHRAPQDSNRRVGGRLDHSDGLRAGATMGV